MSEPDEPPSKPPTSSDLKDREVIRSAAHTLGNALQIADAFPDDLYIQRGMFHRVRRVFAALNAHLAEEP